MRFSVRLTTGVQPEWPAFQGAFGISPVFFGWTPLTRYYLHEYISTHAAAGPAKLSASPRHHLRFTRTLDGTWCPGYCLVGRRILWRRGIVSTRLASTGFFGGSWQPAQAAHAVAVPSQPI